MQSARHHPCSGGACLYLANKCTEEWVLGPFPPSPDLNVQISHFCVIKKRGLNKWCLILDLSSPDRSSVNVNDGILPKCCAFRYSSVDAATEAVVRANRGALLAKVNIKSAYRIVEVDSDDRTLLRMLWEDNIFEDLVCSHSAFALHRRSFRPPWNGLFSNPG